MKHLVDGAAIARANMEMLRAGRILESLFMRSRNAEEKGDIDRSRVQVIEALLVDVNAKLVDLERRIAELERVRV